VKKKRLEVDAEGTREDPEGHDLRLRKDEFDGCTLQRTTNHNRARSRSRCRRERDMVVNYRGSALRHPCLHALYPFGLDKPSMHEV